MGYSISREYSRFQKWSCSQVFVVSFYRRLSQLESNNNNNKNVTSPSNSNLQPHTARSVSFKDNESDKHNENRSDEMKMGSKLGSSIKGNLRKRNKTNDLKKIEESDDNF